MCTDLCLRACVHACARICAVQQRGTFHRIVHGRVQNREYKKHGGITKTYFVNVQIRISKSVTLPGEIPHHIYMSINKCL